MGDTRSKTLSMTAADLRKALRLAVGGNPVPQAHFSWLKRQGLLGGDALHPLLTAKGRRLATARLTTPSNNGKESEPNFQLPDAMDRLANPRNGEAALVEPCDIAAAKRFQGDLQRAGLRQRITQSWSLASLDHGGSKGGGTSARHEPTSMLDARERVNCACKVIGPEFSGLLIDVCLFEKSLTGVERERRWPARSGKLAIALGLRALARHYGLTRTAVG
ncbi:MAG: DUF6456 domain-containing protein [Devosiaceae bacterium]